MDPIIGTVLERRGNTQMNIPRPVIDAGGFPDYLKDSSGSKRKRKNRLKSGVFPEIPKNRGIAGHFSGRARLSTLDFRIDKGGGP
jgi:hypothetical protein